MWCQKPFGQELKIPVDWVRLEWVDLNMNVFSWGFRYEFLLPTVIYDCIDVLPISDFKGPNSEAVKRGSFKDIVRNISEFRSCVGIDPSSLAYSQAHLSIRVLKMMDCQ